MNMFRVHPQVPGLVQVSIAGVWFDIGRSKLHDEAQEAMEELNRACRYFSE